MQRFNLLVCGGRKFNQAAYLYHVLDNVHQHRTITLLIHGDAPGADRLASAWALDRGVPQCKFPANWKGEGKAAGPLRNQRMLDTITHVDGVLAFAGQRGTADMISRATGKNINVFDLREKDMSFA